MENALLVGQTQKGIDIVLKWILIILLLALLVLTLYFGLDDCQKVKLDYNNKSLNPTEFMNIYSDTCLKRSPQQIDFKVDTNFTNNSNLLYSQPSP